MFIPEHYKNWADKPSSQWLTRQARGSVVHGTARLNPKDFSGVLQRPCIGASPNKSPFRALESCVSAKQGGHRTKPRWCQALSETKSDREAEGP